MQTAKDSAKSLIEQLPDSATLNDIMYELYVKQKIERGMQASREGRGAHPAGIADPQAQCQPFYPHLLKQATPCPTHQLH